MNTNSLKISGFVFFSGTELLPGDLLLDPNVIRQWAMKKGFISDPEFQLLHPEKLQSLSKCFSSEDELLIAIALHNKNGQAFYMEYPYIPVKTLIKHGTDIQLVYWRMSPTVWNQNREVVQFGEVRFGFWHPGCYEELCSLSTGKRVSAKFNLMLDKLSSVHNIERFEDGSKEIVVDGTVQARFFKDGRYFDVILSELGEGSTERKLADNVF
ncbi:MAG: hypothetical protein JW963_25835 [Anaerolineales bacterium]|nr:hypothetical protein [Anaerolineales bacterium]